MKWCCEPGCENRSIGILIQSKTQRAHDSCSRRKTMVVSLNMRAGPSPRGYWPGSPSIRPQSRGREAGFRVLRRAEPEGARTDGDLPPNAAKPIGKGDDLIYVGKPKGAKETIIACCVVSAACAG